MSSDDRPGDPPGDSVETAPVPRAVPGTARPRRMRPDVLGAIALGGALGALARYGVAHVIHVATDTFPWATFWTNVSGSFVLGFVLVLIVERFPPSRYARAFVAVGFLGAYTTFSTFAVEVVVLAKDHHAGLAAAYALGSLAAGFLVVWLGMIAGRSAPLRWQSAHGRVE